MRGWLLLLPLLWSGFACAVEPVQIKSDSLLVEHARKHAEFKGHVWLKRDDFELRCDRLVVKYRERAGGELDHAEAYGNVSMQQGDQQGHSDEALYEQARGVLTLIGNAKVQDSSGMVRGEKIVHDINSGETVVLQGVKGERVRLFIEEEDDAKALEAEPSRAKPNREATQ